MSKKLSKQDEITIPVHGFLIFLDKNVMGLTDMDDYCKETKYNKICHKETCEECILRYIVRGGEPLKDKHGHDQNG